MALAATPVGTRCTVFALSGVYRGGAMPGAWPMLPAHQPHAWRRDWRRRRRAWRLRVGGAAEETIAASTRPDVSAALADQRRPRRITQRRLVSVLRRGWPLMLVALLDQAPLPLGDLLPEPWPAVPGIDCPLMVPEVAVRHHAA